MLLVFCRHGAGFVARESPAVLKLRDCCFTHRFIRRRTPFPLQEGIVHVSLNGWDDKHGGV